MTSLPPWLPWALLGAGVILLVAAGVRAVRIARRRAAADAAGFASSAQLMETKPGWEGRAADETAHALAGDLEELTQRLAARLDAKAARLEVLIAQADDRIERLARVAAEPVNRPRSHASAGESRGGTAPASIDDPVADPVTRQIYQLADEGLPTVEIARRLAQHTGKVELILALRRA